MDLKKLFKHFWNEETQSLQHRIYNFLCLMGATNCIVGDVINIVIKAPLFSSVFTLVMSLIFIVLLIFNKNYRPLIWVGLASLLLTLNINWFSNAGYNGSSTLLFMVSFCYFEMLVNEKGRLTVLFIYIADMVALALLQNFRPEWIIPYQSSLDKLIDIVSTFVLLIFLLFLVINIIMNSYERALKKINEKSAELEVVNAKLKELDRVKTEFFSNVSHELRTPLTLILGPIESVIQGTYGNNISSDSPIFGTMLRNGNRLLRLINQLLDFTRIEAGKMAVRKEMCDISEFLRLIISSVESTAKSRNLALAFFDETTGLKAPIDRNLTEKSILNLLSNAIKFTPGGGSIVVQLDGLPGNNESLLKNGRMFSITVKDTGIGIPDDQQKLVFDRFFQADSSANRRYEGTGIGLSLTREMVETQGGKITLKSKHGKGSSFSIFLPADETSSSDSQKSEVDEIRFNTAQSSLLDFSVAPNLKKIKKIDSAEEITSPDTILIVEDNQDMRLYIQESLGDNFSIFEASNGKEGLQTFLEKKPDLVITDIMMPEMDGMEMLRAIRENKEFIGTPVILLTAKSSETDKIKGLDLGAVDYIIKPFSGNELKSRVKSQIAMKKLRDELFRKAEELSLSESRFRDIAEFSASGIAEMKPDGRIVYMNHTGLELFRLHEKEIKTNLSIYDFLSQKEKKRFENLMKKPSPGIEEMPLYRLKRKDGSEFTALLKLSSYEENGEIDSIRLAFMDLNPILGKTLQPGNDFYRKYGLSYREREVITEMLRGFSIKEIGERLFISETTVKTHQQNIYNKMGISSKKELIELVKTEIVEKCGYETLLFTIITELTGK